MPTTSNFGWTTPADTDLVKDGALAIRTLGNGIDTSMAELKGGTTGQILSKTSNTDMDFTWINNDQGDITEVAAGTGITVTSGTGPIPTVALSTPVSVANGGTGITSFGTGIATFLGTPSSSNLAAALTDETGSGSAVFATSPTLVTPNLGTPSAATLTNATGLPIIAGTTGTLTETRGGTNQTTYTTGDLLYASALNTLSKRAVGTSGQVLTVSGGVPTWATPASSGGMTLLSTTTLSGSSTTISSISQDYTNLQIIISGVNISANDYPRIDINGTSGAVYVAGQYNTTTSDSTNLYFNGASDMKSGNVNNVTVLNIYNYANTSYYKAINKITQYYNFSTTVYARVDGGAYLSNTAVTSITILNLSGATFNAGQVRIYGVK